MNADGRQLQQRIRAEACRIGFSRCGFAPMRALPHADFVRRWLDDGNAAGMAYIERGLAKRLDPWRILADVRSVITVGWRYLPPPVPPIDWRQQLRGRIAAYALGTDYHQAVEPKLRELAAYVTGLRSGVAALSYADTGPILEREWAAAGGVGWFGKNTNILHTEDGSYFFLGELLTNLELDADAPVPDHCGTCTRCLDLCPTQALQPGYVLDARRCISYWTIEHRGSIPVDMRSRLGNWVFGCDVCQEVCPWNEKLVRLHGTLDADQLLPYLPDLLRLDEEQFQRRFRHTAMRRAKRDGLVRNVAVVLGNTRNPAAVGSLAQALREDRSALVRAHAAWALGAIGDRRGQSALGLARRGESDEDVRAEIGAALEQAESPSQ